MTKAFLSKRGQWSAVLSLILFLFGVTTGRAQIGTADYITNAVVLIPTLPANPGVVSVSFNNSTGSSEANEPSPFPSTGYQPLRSYWFKFTSDATPGRRVLLVVTNSTAANLIMSVFSGPAAFAPPPVLGGPSNLTATVVAADDNTLGTSPRVAFSPAINTTYYVSVDVVSSTSGGSFQVYLTSDVPSNDLFANRVVLSTGTSGTALSSVSTNAHASKETIGTTPEPPHAGNTGGSSVWYSWTPATTGQYQFTVTPNAGFVPLLGIYTTNAAAVNFANMVSVTTNGPSSTTNLVFDATAGRQYYIAVDGFNNGTSISEGDFTLSWNRLGAAAVSSSGYAGTFGFSAASYSVTEMEGTVQYSTAHRSYRGSRITISRSVGNVGRIAVTVASVPWTGTGVFAAIPGTDFAAVTNTIYFDDFQRSADFYVPTRSAADNNTFVNKLFGIQILGVQLDPLESPTIQVPVATSVTVPVTITDETRGVNFGRAVYLVDENQSTVGIDVRRGPQGSDLGNGAAVPWRINNATLGSGTDGNDNSFALQAGSDYAETGVDFSPTSGTINFGSGNNLQRLDLNIINDATVEFNEDFEIELYITPGSTVAWSLGNSSVSHVTILQDKGFTGEQTPGSVDRAYNPDSDGLDYAVSDRSISLVYDDKQNGSGPFDPSNFDVTTDPPYNTTPGANDMVFAVAVHSATTNLYIGGAFTAVNTVTRKGIARINPNGSLDTTFNPGTGADGPVQAIALQPDGKPVIVGGFGSVDNVQRIGVARLTTTGALDGSFTPGVGAGATVWALAIQPDGKIIIGGEFLTVAGSARSHVARLNSNGSLDTSFDPGALGIDGPVYALALQPDGKVIIGGEFTSVGGASRNHIARLNSDGSLDTSYTPGGGASSTVWALSIDTTTTNVYAGGSFTTVDFRSRNRIARFTPAGSLDTTFDPGTGFDDTVFTVKLTGGRLLVGGRFSDYNTTRRVGLARLFTDGSLDTSFMDTAYNHFAGPTKHYFNDPNNPIFALDTQSDGNIIVGGSFTQFGGGFHRADRRVRYNFARVIGGASEFTGTPGNMQFTKASYAGDEPSGPNFITVTRDNGSLAAATITYVRTNRPAGPGAAVASDFNFGTSVLTWISTYGTFNVTRMLSDSYAGANNVSAGRVGDDAYLIITNNPAFDGDRSLDLFLQSPGAFLNLGGDFVPVGLALGAQYKSLFNIVDDDAPRGTIQFSSTNLLINENSGTVTLSVDRVGGSAGTVTVQYYTATNYTYTTARAVPNTDFTPLTLTTLTFGAGQTNKTITVTIKDNVTLDADRAFSVLLTNVGGGATLTNYTNATVYIIDNDSPPGKLTFAQSSQTVQEDAGVAQVIVDRKGGSVGQVSVDAIVEISGAGAGFAVGGVNFTTYTTNLVWANADSSSRTVTIPIIRDGVVNASGLQFRVRLANPVLATIGVIGTDLVTINNTDSYGLFSFNTTKYFANETAGNAVVTVVRNSGSIGTVDVQIGTADGSAIGGVNYTPLFPTITFAPGQLSTNILIPVLAYDPAVTSNRQFTVSLLGTTPSGLLASPSSSTVEIVNTNVYNVPAGTLDTTFDTSAGANGAVFAMTLQSDGKLLVGGDFTELNGLSRNRIGRLNPDGSFDSTFDPATGPNGTVRAIGVYLGAGQSNRVAVAGVFTNFAGTNRNFITRLNADATLDTSFNPGSGTDGPIYALLVETNNQLIAGGEFTLYGGVSQVGLVRIGTNGTRDASFNVGSGPAGPVYALAKQPDGKILVGGDFKSFNGNTNFTYIVRLNSNGSIDTNFITRGVVTGAVRAVAIQSTGRVIAGGSFISSNGLTNLVALNAVNGSVDTNFTSAAGGFNDTVFAIAVQEDDKVIAAGNFTLAGGLLQNRIIRLKADTGAVDPTINFGAGANSFIAALAYQSGYTNQPAPQIYIGGDFTTYDNTAKDRIARIHGGTVSGNGRFEYTTSVYTISESAGIGSFSIRRKGGAVGVVNITNLVTEITATNGVHFTLTTPQVLTFVEGETIKTVSFPVIDDFEANADRYLMLSLSPELPGVLGDQPNAFILLQNDDGVIQFDSAAYNVSENVQGGVATITVVRTGSTASTATVSYLTVPGTATAGVDYTPASGNLTFNPGESFKIFTVGISNDSVVELPESLTLLLTNLVGAVAGADFSASLTINDDDVAPGVFNIGQANYTVNEADGFATVNVVRTNGYSGKVSVTLTTLDGTATNGVPPAGDYVTTTSIVVFDQGETNKTVSIPITLDSLNETNEFFVVSLSNPSVGTSIGNLFQARVTIVNNNLLLAGNVRFTNATFTANEDSGFATIYVERYGLAGTLFNGTSSIDVVLNGGTAINGTHYTNAGTVLTNLTWDPGKSNAIPVNIQLIGNNTVDGDRTIALQLANPLFDGVPDSSILGSITNAVLTLQDNDVSSGVITFTSPQYSFSEAVGTALISVIRTNGTDGLVRVAFDTSNGTALAGTHYAGLSTNLFFPNGVAGTNVSIVISNNSLLEGDLTALLTLARPAILVDDGVPNNRFYLIATDPEVAFGTNVQVIFYDIGFNDAYYDTDLRILNVAYDSATSTANDIRDSIFFTFYFDTELDGTSDGTDLVGALPTGLTVPVLALSTSTLLIQDDEPTSGGVDQGFDPGTGANGPIMAVDYRPTTGRILIAGDFTLISGVARTNLARLNADASVDFSFSPGALLQGAVPGSVRALATYTNGTQSGKILVGGQFTSVGGASKINLARVGNDGVLDAAFPIGSGPNAPVYAVAIQSDGRAVVGGAFTTFSGTNASFLVRLNTDGSIDSTFNPVLGPNAAVRSIAINPGDGSILIGGDFLTVNGVARTNVARLSATGTLDNTFVGPSLVSLLTNSSVRAVALQVDGAVIVGGIFDTVGTNSRANITRLSSTGAADDTFNSKGAGADGTVNSIVLQVDGKILVGGEFLAMNGVYQGRISRLLTTGDLDGTMNTGLGADAAIMAMAIQADAKVIVAGAFTSINGTARNRIARLNGGDNLGSGSLTFSAPVYNFAENSGFAKVTIVRISGASNAVDVAMSISTSSLLLSNPANPGDYVAPPITNLTFAAGQTIFELIIPIIDNTNLSDGDRGIFLELYSPTAGAALGNQTNAVLTILNDDGEIKFSSALYSAFENQGVAQITVDRAQGTGQGATGPASATFTVTAGTAQAGVDFVAATNTVNFVAGQTSATFNVTLNNNAIVNSPRTVLLTLQAPVTGSAVLGSVTNAVLDILDDESAPGVISFASVTNFVAENQTNALITVIRTNGSAGTLTVTYGSSDGSALAGQDYTAVTNTLTFLDGEVSKTILVPITDDNLQEADEAFTLQLFNPSVGSLGLAATTVVIQDNDVSIQFTTNLLSISEGAGFATIDLVRAGLTNQSVVVQVTTTDGTAHDPNDYTNGTQGITFGPGELLKSFNVTINEDTLVEGDETILIALTSGDSHALAAGTTNAVLTILDNDTNSNIGVFVVVADPVYTNATFTYIITVTNSGPSTLTGVTITNMLQKPALTVLSASNALTGASITVADVTPVIIDLPGSLPPGTNAVIHLNVMAPGAAQYVTNVVSVTAAEFENLTVIDPDTTNNTVTVVTQVLNATAFFAADYTGTLLVSEAPGAVNGGIDPGETVTMSLALRNTGNRDATNLVVTLLATNGITPLPVNPQTYGTVITNATVARSFQFTAPPTGTSMTLVVSLMDTVGPTTYNPVSFTFALGRSVIATNTDGPIIIPDNGAAFPYPSTNITAGLTGIISKVTVTLSNLTHSFPDDLDIMLVHQESGQKVMLMSDVGAGAGVTNIVLTIDDAAPIQLPDESTPSITAGGSFRPANYTPRNELVDIFPAPAPSAPFATNLAAFNGLNPNGTWLLYVNDDSVQDSGSLAGWSIQVTAVTPVSPTAGLTLSATTVPEPVFAGSNVVYSVVVSNRGPSVATNIRVTNTLAAGVTYVGSTGPGAILTPSPSSVVVSYGSLAVGASVTNDLILTPHLAGLNTNVTTVTGTETDPFTGDNLVERSFTVTASSDLAIAASVPATVSLGNNVTFSLGVTNLGPSTATNVVLTGTIPAGVTLVSSNSSQGTLSVAAGTLTANLGTLTSNSTATVAFTVTPSIAGTLSTIASVSSPVHDGNSVNNSTNALTTVVTASSDLAITVTANPQPVVVGSNLTYSITVTNHGPSTAASVVVTNPLGSGVTFVSATNSQGAYTFSSGVVTFQLGSVPVGTNVTASLVVTPTSQGTVTATFGVGASTTDPVGVNNTNTIATTVVGPAIDIVSAGAVLSSELNGVVNGSIDPGELVTISFGLRNKGTSDATSVVATLQPSGGVTSPSGAQNYGTLVAGGSAVSRSYSFTASGVAGGTINATFRLNSGITDLGTVVFTFQMGSSSGTGNGLTNSVPDVGQAAIYPYTINVSGLPGTIIGASVVLSNVSHTFPDDLDILLVGPAGQKIILMSDAGGGVPMNNATLTFSDSAGAAVPDQPLSAVITGSYRPSNYLNEPATPSSTNDVFNAPAPAGPYSTNLAVFNGTNPNGDWKLFIMDDQAGDQGSIKGWSIQLITATPVNPSVDLAVSAAVSQNPVLVGNTLLYTITVTNRGPNTATNILFTNIVHSSITSIGTSNSVGAVLTVADRTISGSLGNLLVGTNAVVYVYGQAGAVGAITNFSSVISGETDVVPGNNSVNLVTTAEGVVFNGTTLISPNVYSISLTTRTGHVIVLESSTNLVTWVPVATNSSGLSPISFLITNSGPQKFYRAVEQ